MNTRKASVIIRLKEHIRRAGELGKQDLSDSLVFDSLNMAEK